MHDFGGFADYIAVGVTAVADGGLGSLLHFFVADRRRKNEARFPAPWWSGRADPLFTPVF